MCTTLYPCRWNGLAFAVLVLLNNNILYEYYYHRIILYRSDRAAAMRTSQRFFIIIKHIPIDMARIKTMTHSVLPCVKIFYY